MNRLLQYCCASLLILSYTCVHASDEDRKILDNLKQTIKNDAGDEENLSLKYDIPIAPVNMKLGSMISDKDVTGKLSNAKVSTDEQETTKELLEKGYKAASLGSMEAAIVLYKKVLAREPNNINALFALGSIYQNLHQFKEAKSMYSKVIEIDPNDQNTINNYLALMVQESPTNALSHLRELEKANPDFSPVKAQIGMVYAKLGDYDMAEMYMRRAISLSPEVLNYRYNLAVMLDKSGSTYSALQAYKQLIDVGSKDLSSDMVRNIRLRIDVLQNSLVKS
jgi:tetratricopeptide (TPR) repeat protein